MADGRTAGRALWALSALGVAAILATIILLLGIQHKAVTEQRALEREAVVGAAEERCSLLQSVLVGRIDQTVTNHPEARSLLQLADEVRSDLADFSMLKEAGQGIQLLVVDERLQPIWPPAAGNDRELLSCAQHILEERQCSRVLSQNPPGNGRPRPYLCYTCPIRRGGHLLGGIVIQKDLDFPLQDGFAALNRTMALTVILMQAVLLLALGAIACSARKAIAAAERRIAEEERLAAIGNLAAGVAHEIRNPLNTIALTARYLERLIGRSTLDAELRAEANKSFEIVAGELGRLTRTLDDFVVLAKPTDLALRDCDAEQVLDDALALFAREFDEAGVRLARTRAGAAPIACDPDRLGQVFANIIRNSIQAMHDGGTLSVTTEVADGRVRAAFADTGPGISPTNLHRLFEPYFSTKRSGLGLGLSLSLRIVKAHGGTIEAANQPSGGALFTVTLPIRPTASEATHAG